jgi:hypothetical protein
VNDAVAEYDADIREDTVAGDEKFAVNYIASYEVVVGDDAFAGDDAAAGHDDLAGDQVCVGRDIPRLFAVSNSGVGQESGKGSRPWHYCRLSW